MELMARYPDKYFDLAIVDPPYGIGAGVDKRIKIETRSNNNFRAKYARPGGIRWDNEPPKENYFDELFRVSKNQIIWGGNYFKLSPTKCIVVWDKMTYIPSMSQIEIAWTSFKNHSQLVKINSNQVDRFHISQKPIKLYKWLLDKYAKPGNKILDTHLGSGSIAIACHDYGFDLTACELDVEYYDKAMQRINNHIKQIKLFQ